MQRRHKPETVAKRFGVAKSTVIQWCQSGLMPAVNVASPNATRCRWRMSDEDINAFESKRANRPETQHAVSNARKSVSRPVKDYFTTTGGGQ